jgi:glutamate formiminotransferase/formiminotetrahydrofolate cyclodeaminase
VNIHQVYEEVKKEAKKIGIKVTGSEIVGLIPKDSLVLAGKFYSKKKNIKLSDEEKLVSIAIDELGLSDLYQFIPEEKIIEYIVEETGPLVSSSVKGFLSELASKSPAPGGGSVAALSGALGSALSSMVCNLTIGKDKYKNFQDEIKTTLEKSEKLRKKLTKLIDKDTEAFNDVITAFKMPKETENEKTKRNIAIQRGYKIAAKIPLETAKVGEKILDVAMIVAKKGNKNSITDAAVSALMGKACVQSAILNVKINLSSIKEKKFIDKISLEIDKLEKNVKLKTDKIIEIVNSQI